MAVNWDIVRIESEATSGICRVLHWTAIDFLVVNDVTHTGRMYGAQYVNGDSESENFILYENVSKEKAIEWVKNSLGSEKVNSIEEEIANQISESQSPTINTVNPWDMGDNF